MHDLGSFARKLSRRTAIHELIATAAGLDLTGALSSVFAAPAADLRDWLTEAGRYLYVTRPTRWSAEVESWRDGKIFDTAKIEAYIGDFPVQREGTPPKTLVKFTEEGIRKGRLILYEGDRAWMYFRGTNQAIRVPLAEQLVGDADVASILNVDLRHSYVVSGVDRETGDGKPMTALTLTASKDDAPFGGVVLKVNADTAQPIRAQFSTLSGKLAKTIDYLSFQPYQGRHVLQSVRIKVLLNAKSDYTIIRYLAVSAYELPRRLFTPTLLKDF